MSQPFRSERGFDPRGILKHCQLHLAAMLRCLRQAVEIESPSGSRTDIDRMARFFAVEFKRRGGKVRVLPHARAGAAVVAEFWGEKRGRGPQHRPILLLGHHDTVWNRGTLAAMPFRIRGGRVFGPGALDMKSGIVCA